MKKTGLLLSFLLIFVLLAILPACTPAAAPATPQSPAEAPAEEQPAAEEPAAEAPATEEEPAGEQQSGGEPSPAEPGAPEPTLAPTSAAAPLSTATPAQLAPTGAATDVLEGRTVELEWPQTMELGDSDIIRLALIPTSSGYIVESEFPDHQVRTQEIPVERPAGYTVVGAARLDGIGFEISPSGEQVQPVPPDKEAAWRWTVAPQKPGTHRLAVELVLRWVPQDASVGTVREAQAYSRGVEVQVTSILGMSRAQAGLVGIAAAAAVLLAGGFLVVGLARRGRSSPFRLAQPNDALKIERPSPIRLNPDETGLLQGLFGRYARILLQQEFLSGYSGARTFLVLPVHPDGRADAHTIVKLGRRVDIQHEFDNYENYVKDSLPPMTARIQHAPVTVRSGSLAALQYTFIAEPGRLPASLRQVLLQDPAQGGVLIEKLFATFGPNWWMQRSPYTFRLAQEYDRLLPPHYVLQPVEAGPAGAPVLDEKTPPGRLSLTPGQLVRVRSFPQFEPRQDGASLTLTGRPVDGQPALRLRWLATRPPANHLARVVADRWSLLAELTRGACLYGLPDPITALPGLLDHTVAGTRATIHGDLNLENILAGPGGFIWLIDFAQTRPGHTLFDFARLEAEITAHVLAEETGEVEDYLQILKHGHPLLRAVRSVAEKCLFNPNRPQEYELARYATCLGSLKYTNITPKARALLYLTAADALERFMG